jgi:hypothetical protein
MRTTVLIEARELKAAVPVEIYGIILATVLRHTLHAATVIS